MISDLFIFWDIFAPVLSLALICVPVLLIVLFVKMGRATARLRDLEEVAAQLVAEVKRLRLVAGLAGQGEPSGPVANPSAKPEASASPGEAPMGASPLPSAAWQRAVAGPSPTSRPPTPLTPPQQAKPDTRPESRADPQADPRADPRMAENAEQDLRHALTQASAPPQDAPLVFNADRLADAVLWLRENWAYALAALSLALAGVFFVHYGIEQGLLPPPLRVLAGLGFGLGLIAAGEALRRRWGDGGKAGYLPSVFSGAGIVAVFAAIAAGRLMYGLYGPGVTFAGLGLAAAGAVGLGWRHGPLLVAVGLLGAAATPFLVNGGGGAPVWLLGYYVGVTAVGLAVDALRRWAWVSVLALVLGHLGLAVMAEAGAGRQGWIWALLAMVLLAIILPQRSLVPDHPGPSVVRALWLRRGDWPVFPVRLATGNMVLVVLVLLGEGERSALSLLMLAVLALLMLLWADRAPGLRDLPAVAAAGFLGKLGLSGDLIWHYRSAAEGLRGPEVAAPDTAALVVGLAMLISAAAGWRSLRSGSLPAALMAVLVAPLAVLLLEAFWAPASVLGAFAWALHVMVVAAGAVALAAGFARADGAPGRRSAWAALAALSLVALALFVTTSAAALTLSLAVLLLVAVLLDRRFDLLELGWFVQAAAAVLSYRLVIDPGIAWAEGAPWTAVLASYLGVAAACLAGVRLMPMGRATVRAVLESLGLSAVALWVNILILRSFTHYTLPDGTWMPDPAQSHWGASLHALPWLVLAMGQAWRAGVSTGFVWRVRMGLAIAAGVLAAFGLALALGPYNPLFGHVGDPNSLVRGPVLLDSLLLAYALPGVMLGLVGPRLRVLRWRARQGMQAAGAVLVLVYIGTEIRRLWQGPFIGGSGVMPGELYAYTLAMMLTGAALLWQALRRRSVSLQRVAMAVIGLTVAKVFLWDASGLSGLLRVLSFAGLGLALAGLAWLNRWIGQQISKPGHGA